MSEQTANERFDEISGGKSHGAGGGKADTVQRDAWNRHLLRSLFSLGWLGYAMAVVGTVGAAWVRWDLARLFGPGVPPYITFYPVVTLSALFGGVRAGLLATVVSAGMVSYFFLQPIGDFRIHSPADIAGLIIFTAINLMMSVVGGTLRNALHRTERQARELAQSNDSLARANADMENKVQEQTVKLRETLAELEHMSYSMVHDMRAPLRAMEGFAMLLEEECKGCLRTHSLEYFKIIRQSANRLDRLIIDALNYNRMVREQLPLSPIDMAPLLRNLVETYPNLHPTTADISIEFKELVVVGNESLLTQCFGNVLGNAIKFVATGVRPRVRVWAESRDGSARIWTEDNGIGIAKEHQTRIFRMFHRLHREEDYPGTGIGLAIVSKAVERMNGRLGLEAEPGKGSRFWIELPTPKINNTARPDFTHVIL